MASVINTNMSSLNAQRNLQTSQGTLQTSLQRLSSGMRINSAKDDAAGLAIANRMTSQINGLDQAARNANDGISLAQTAEGALGQVGDALQRIRTLAVQSANSTNSGSDRAALQNEVSQLVGEIGRIGQTTSFNGLNLLDGTYANQQFQVGANAGQTIGVSIADARAQSLGATTQTSTAGFDSTTDLTTGLTINGTTVDTTGAGNITDVIGKVNAVTGTTGITASRATTNTFDLGALPVVGATATDSLTINGVAVTFAGGEDAAAASTLINTKSTQTGVTASVVGGNVVLSGANGGDITVKSTIADFGNVGTTAATITAGLQLSSKLGTAITTAGTLGTDLNLASAANVDNIVSTLDVSSITNANQAIATIDFALTQVNATRAQLGATQNRFSAVITNLQTTSENLSGSRSRIQDTDFAAETANLTKSQILQQAGTAMLAQANSIPNNVLSLLKG